MDFGKLNRKIAIQSQSTTQDDAGQPLNTWTTFASPWAHIRFMNGVETMKGDSPTSVAKASIRIRYREDITNAMQVVYNGITYRILAVLPDEAKREHVDLACEVVR